MKELFLTTYNHETSWSHGKQVLFLLPCSKGQLIRVYLESRYYLNDLSWNVVKMYEKNPPSFLSYDEKLSQAYTGLLLSGGS